MYIGADYYPEHWEKSRWETDAKLMKRAGFNITRLAEFAWVMMEPAEGCFEFGWLDEALAVLARHGISAILCTPTAVAPAWVARKYPEILRQNQDGTRAFWGVRKDQCYTSGAYRMLSQRITSAMASHFARTPNVIGWQTDNEFDGRCCYCESCRKEFQDFLRGRYGTLDNLNRAMGKHFWGHYATTWDEVEIPAGDGSHNPSVGLEWKRFNSYLNVRFQREQVRILRHICPHHFVTHNFMGLYPRVDYFDLAEDLDHVSWDNYPIGGRPYLSVAAAAAADLMRGCKKKNVWIIESTSGPHGWGTYGRNPRDGEMRTFAFQQFAHGCDHYVWFRWRACTAGREQYWHGILGHDGRPLRRYRQATQIAKQLRKLEKHLAGTTVKARVAIVYDYDSLWAVEMQGGYQGNDYVKGMLRYYEPLLRAGVNVDFLKPGDDLSGYKLVLAPCLYIMPDGLAKRINDYVRAGGVFFCDQRTGVKDSSGLCHERTLPGLLSPALGIEIQEYESVYEAGYKMIGSGGLAGEFTAHMGADWVIARKAKALVGYSDSHMKKFAAVTRNAFGRGAGWYCGTVAKEPAFYEALIAALLKDARIRLICRPVEGVEVSVRQGRGKRLLFVINYTEEKKSITVPAGGRELLTGKTTGKTMKLARFGVAVIRL